MINVTLRQRLVLEWIWFRRLPIFFIRWIKWRKTFLNEMQAHAIRED